MTEMSQTAAEKNAVPDLWWMLALRGALLLIFGIMMFTWGRGTTLSLLIQTLGAYWLVGGLIDLFQGILGKTEKPRFWAIGGGVVSMVAGFFVMGHPIITGLFAGFYLTYFMGIAAAVVGLAQIIDGKDGERSMGTLIMGIFSIIFGVIVMFNPLMTQATILFVLPFWAILAGGAAILSSLTMRGQTEVKNETG